MPTKLQCAEQASGGAMLCTCPPNLIAAAPDLYEALKDMREGWRYIRAHHGDLYGVGWDRCEQAADAALAKAQKD